ncbi:MAG: preprotein translocase subunit SecE [Candidatus Levybacteria bacterium]|nr:preprotein translocase subunit SecE [Candidatus Levybacteria bacterium]MBP9814986.1 preprotein translocase subunit SecE [Candidatus Levybacteria bacterium]
MLTFLKQVQAELMQVEWPSRTEIMRLTAVVIAISIFVGIYLGIADFLFAELLKLIIQ